jgi:hypothetical protein
VGRSTYHTLTQPLLSHSYSHAHAHLLPLSLSFTLSHTVPLSYTLTLTLPRAHTHSLSLSLSPLPPFPDIQLPSSSLSHAYHSYIRKLCRFRRGSVHTHTVGGVVVSKCVNVSPLSGNVGVLEMCVYSGDHAFVQRIHHHTRRPTTEYAHIHTCVYTYTRAYTHTHTHTHRIDRTQENGVNTNHAM